MLRLQPDEGMKLYLMSKDPGPGGLRFKNEPLNLSYAESLSVGYRDAYERLLMDVVRGNPTLFMRKDEVAAAWRWIDPILEGWAPRASFRAPTLPAAGDHPTPPRLSPATAVPGTRTSPDRRLRP